MANNFKPFATGSGANVTSQQDYETLPALSSGFLSGKASSSQVNKALRQGTFVSSCLAQFIANELNVDVLDDGNANGFLANLIIALNSRADAMITTAFPKRTFGTKDYIRIPDVPGGLIVQWGMEAVPPTSATVFSLPTAFPNAGLAAIASAADSTTTTSYRASVGSLPQFPTTSQIRLTNTFTNNAINVFYIAIGY
ncbi:gp53-like domain-containing protein [Klebsiella aerogenes]|uniref:gp53-like domain-containing protein n=1 Tax=Klebsiella aerogenes TaxID=548 RepID=UPI002FF8520F